MTIRKISSVPHPLSLNSYPLSFIPSSNSRYLKSILSFSSLILFFIILTVPNCFSEIKEKEKTDGRITSYKLLGRNEKIQMHLIEYYSDGLKVKGILYLPPAKRGAKLPVIIFCHDGINGISRDHERSSLRIAKKGYAVFCPAYRGEFTSYRDRKLPDDKRDKSEGEIEIAKGEVNDVLNAVKMISIFKWADMNRLGMIGVSHGALISLIAASKSNNVRALVSGYGVMDIYKWWDYLKKNDMLGKDEITKRTYGDGPQDQPESFSIRNGVSYAKNLKCPVLILQGSKDKIVPEEQARFLKSVLDENKLKSEMQIYPDCEHGFLVYAPYDDEASKAEKEQAEMAWKLIFTFLEKNLK